MFGLITMLKGLHKLKCNIKLSDFLVKISRNGVVLALHTLDEANTGA